MYLFNNFNGIDQNKTVYCKLNTLMKLSHILTITWKPEKTGDCVR